eukprot:symbB.v1.2.021110.t1/scaffold1808.1/size103924/2
MLSRRRRAFHLRRVMLAAGLWMKLRKRRRCAQTSRQNSGSPMLTSTRRDTIDTMDDIEDVMDGAPSDDNFEPPQPRGPVRSRRPPVRKSCEEGETVPSGPKPRKILLLRSVFEGQSSSSAIRRRAAPISGQWIVQCQQMKRGLECSTATQMPSTSTTP